MKKYIYFLPVVIFSLLLSACSDDDTRTLDQGKNSNAVFTSSSASIQTTKATENTYELTVVRGNTKYADDIELAINFPTVGDFTVSNRVLSFAEGQNSAKTTITFDYDQLELLATYRVGIKFADSAQGPLFPSGIDSTTINITKSVTLEDLVFDPYGSGTLTSTFFSSPSSWPVTIYKAQGIPYFRVEFYEANYPIYFAMNNALTEVLEFRDWQPTGYVHPSYGMVSLGYDNSSIVGKNVTFGFYFLIPDGRTFGLYNETLTMP